MKFTDLSFTELRSICINEAQRILSKTNIDLIVFVERAGLPLALYMQEVLGCKILGIHAERKADVLKSIFFKWGVGYCL